MFKYIIWLQCDIEVLMYYLLRVSKLETDSLLEWLII